MKYQNNINYDWQEEPLLSHATALLNACDNSYVPVALYIMLAAAISLIAIASVRNRSNQDLA
ncbi:hypothetical protein NCCP133_12890 [Cytobacillus sp. NCCP-133]|nr:hypothetical protein [Cytobacillus sp. NCCP-133]GLB59156.1 hypothetical protein NCCP133_12890 [Cytobacillus sp. NCCP-133]